MCIVYIYIQSYVVWLYPIESLKKRSSHWFAMSPEAGVCCFGGPWGRGSHLRGKNNRSNQRVTASPLGYKMLITGL